MARVVQSVGPALVLCAGLARFGDMVGQPVRAGGTGARVPHSGQADGNSPFRHGRSCVKGPHFLHHIFIGGIDHLPPPKRSCGGLVRAIAGTYQLTARL